MGSRHRDSTGDHLTDRNQVDDLAALIGEGLDQGLEHGRHAFATGPKPVIDDILSHQLGGARRVTLVQVATELSNDLFR